MYMDSYVICVIWSSHHWCFFFMKREFKDSSDKRFYAQSLTKLCEERCWVENKPHKCSRSAKAETHSVSRSLCARCAPGGQWAPAAGCSHARSPAWPLEETAGKRGLKGWGGVKGGEMQFREEGSWTYAKMYVHTVGVHKELSFTN